MDRQFECIGAYSCDGVPGPDCKHCRDVTPKGVNNMIERLKSEYHAQFVTAFEDLRHQIAQCDVSVSNGEVDEIINAVERLHRWKRRREDCLSIMQDEPNIHTILSRP